MFDKTNIKKAEHKAAYHKKWVSIPENHERVRVYKKKYYKEHPEIYEKRKPYFHKWAVKDYKENRELYREKYYKRREKKIAPYRHILDAQNNKCAICGIHEDDIKRFSLCVDHNHETGKVRGFLCSRCNLMLGFIERYPTLVNPMLSYLGDHE